MKYKILILFAFTIFLINIEESEAICCGAGCSPSANVCCTPSEGGPSVGFVGCFDANAGEYVCPDSSVGQCLTCGNCDPISGVCEWQGQLSSICNSCEAEYDSDGFPTDSQCSTGCPGGTTKCSDGTCQEDCSAIPIASNGDDGKCNADLDGVCDPNCLANQDLDCGGDSDGDGLSDSQELSLGTNPNNPDSDGDGFSDGEEVANGTSPTDINDKPPPNPPTDTDRDGIPDAQEDTNGNGIVDPGETDPNHPDSDGDGFSDGEEVANGTSPTNPNDKPSPIGGTTCTVSSGNCCLPIEDSTCDLDCVAGLDPNCIEGASSLNDGLCSTLDDGICDVNCVIGVDIPDCQNFAYSPASNDGCSPLEDNECDLDCPLDLDPDCIFAPGVGECNNDGICEETEHCGCDDCIENPANACVPGLFCCGGVCSGDVDEDLICDRLDYCTNTFDDGKDVDKQKDEDNDCYVGGERSTLFGNCGDQCDLEDKCFDIYGSKQCCDDLAGTTGSGAFFGFTSDCGNVNDESIGCWETCAQEDADGNIVTFEIGQCIDGARVVTKLQNNIPIERFEEPCTSIPLIPFYTNFSIAMTFLILLIYYVFRKKY